ncbi:MAG: tripartite tricarboxylate transporter permease [Gemmobacter sp.]|nr:tripartite tricarboxylate transporter permease [Gemmobacter sp.]
MIPYWAAFAEGLGNVLSFPNILIPVMGTALAMVVSFLPGIGGASLAAIMVVITLQWDPVSVLLLFGALTGGATFMGSVTAILFNIPGNSASAVTLIDGHPMARAGLPRTALAAAATASALGSVFGVVLLMALLPVMRPVLLEFGPLERLLLAVWGLSTIIAILNGSPLRAMTVSGLGLLLAMVGSDPQSSQPRWTFGNFALTEGLATEAMLLGFFTLSELLAWRRGTDLHLATNRATQGDSVLAGVLAVLRHPGLVLRASAIGTLVGVVPGVGGTVAGFVAYGQAVQTARGDRSRFGKGDIRGVISPEAAVDAKDGGSLLPVVAFGLPGSEGGVFLLTVLAIHGLTPGPEMLGPGLAMTFTLIMALLLSNLLTSVLGLALAPALARLTRLPLDRIALPVLVVGLVTVIHLNGVLVDLHAAVGFALLGYLFRRHGWPRVPFVIAFVLGASIEANLSLSLQLFDAGRLDLAGRPAAWVIAIMILFSVAWMMSRVVRAGPEPEPLRRSDPLLALGLAGAVGVLAVVAMAGPQAAYSPYALALCLGTLGLCCAIALQGVAGRRLARDGAEGGPVVPRAHRVPLALMAAFPFGVWLVGLPLSTGLMVALWMASGGPPRWMRGVRAVVLGGAVCGLTLLYLDRVAVLDLPAPRLPVPLWAR